MRGIYMISLCWLLACSDEPPAVMVDCVVSDLSLRVTAVKYTDCGISNGEITVSASGGSSPYLFKLSGDVPQASPTFGDLRADLYTVEVEDADGCSSSVKTLVSSKEGFGAQVSVTPSGCEDNQGTITVDPVDGVPPYKYQLGENSNYELNNSWSDLASREYSVWITDSIDCFIGVYMYVPSGVSYLETVQPIIAGKCAISSCHGGGQEPDLQEYANVKEQAATIEQLIIDESSTKYEMLTAQEKSLISCWIADGAQNN